MKPSTIIGLSGTNGSGKDTIGKILADKYGYLFISVTELLRDEAKKQGLDVDRANLRAISAQWRKEYGLGVLVSRAYDEYKPKADSYSGLVISSLRNPGEVDKLHELGGILLWSDADPKLRFDRIQKNTHLRNRAGEDDKTFEEFLAEEEAEMNPATPADSTILNMHRVKQMADIVVLNEYADQNALADELSKKLGLESRS